jgi:hypothetical protein
VQASEVIAAGAIPATTWKVSVVRDVLGYYVVDISGAIWFKSALLAGYTRKPPREARYLFGVL